MSATTPRPARDWLKWGALSAAIVGTASAEYSLALAAGFGPWTAACVPAALDLYAIRAMRAGRDVWAAVSAMVGTNAASHLLSAGVIDASWGLVVAVSAITPLVLWRVHRLAGHAPASAPVVESSAPASAPAPAPVVERVHPAPAPAPVAVPAGARTLPIVARPVPAPALPSAPASAPAPAPVAGDVQLTTDGEAVPYPSVVAPASAPAPARTRTRVAAADRTRTRVSAPVVESSAPESSAPADDAALVTAARAEYADLLGAGGAPSLRALRTRYGIGQVRAQRIRTALTA